MNYIFKIEIVLCVLATTLFGQFEASKIFPVQNQHVHSSSITECPNGDFITVWFQGSGERQADDVRIMGARLKKGANKWSEPFVMVDYPGFPDVNPTVIIDPQKRLWLFWYTVVANQWESSLPRYRISSDYMNDGPPKWDWQEVLLMKPGGKTEYGIQPNDPFVKTVERKLNELHNYLFNELSIKDPVELQHFEKQFERLRQRTLPNAKGVEMMRKGREYKADGSFDEKLMGYPIYRRIGWQTKNKPVILNNSRLIVPFYSDEFSFSLMAITDDWGNTWKFSEPLVNAGNIQPTILIKKNGNLVTFMRDNGPAPKRLMQSESADNGLTWSMVKDSDLPNPASGADAVTLSNGHWAIVYNDSEENRRTLAVSLSDDEGETWKWTRRLETGVEDEMDTSSSYPSIIQAKDRMLHVVYSYSHNKDDGERHRTIKHVKLPESWITEN